MVCGLLGLQRKKLRRKREGHKFHRKGKSTIVKRNLKKLTGKSCWFKNKEKDADEEKEKKKEWKEREKDTKETEILPKKNKKEPKAVLFVPFTPNSILAKNLRAVEESMETLSGTKMKIVEKAGIQLKSILVKTNPWSGLDCRREGCLPCATRTETGEGEGIGRGRMGRGE